MNASESFQGPIGHFISIELQVKDDVDSLWSYRIAVNFRRSIGSENSAEKTFADCLKPIIGGCSMPPNFTEKTFTDGCQTSKFMKLSPSKFPAI